MLSLVFGIVFLFFACSPTPPTGKIMLDKTQFEPGEEIKINFTAEGTLGKNPWIGIIPSSVAHGDEAENDANDLTYHLKK